MAAAFRRRRRRRFMGAFYRAGDAFDVVVCAGGLARALSKSRSLNTMRAYIGFVFPRRLTGGNITLSGGE